MCLTGALECPQCPGCPGFGGARDQGGWLAHGVCAAPPHALTSTVPPPLPSLLFNVKGRHYRNNKATMDTQRAVGPGGEGGAPHRPRPPAPPTHLFHALVRQQEAEQLHDDRVQGVGGAPALVGARPLLQGLVQGQGGGRGRGRGVSGPGGGASWGRCSVAWAPHTSSGETRQLHPGNHTPGDGCNTQLPGGTRLQP